MTGMSKRKLFRNTLRSALRSKERFLSLFGIIAISTGFFSGLKVTGSDMKQSADRYYRETGLADLHLRSTAGFCDEELDLLAARKEVAQVCGGYQETVFMPVSESTADVTVKIYSLTPSGKKEGQQINQPVLTEGRMPEKANECLIEVNTPSEIAVGDTVRAVIPDGAETLLKQTEFTVVGRADSSMYVDFERGTTTVGNGRIDCFLLVPPDAFDSGVYTDVWLRLKDAAEISSFEQRYLTVVNDCADAILADRKKLCAPRAEQMRETIEQKLADVRRELDEGKEQYEEGLKELNQSVSNGRAELKKAEKELKDGREELDKLWKDYKEKAADYEKNAALIEQQQKTIDAQEKQANGTLDTLREKVSRIEYVLGVVHSYRDSAVLPPYPTELQDLINEMAEYDSEEFNVSQAMFNYFSAPVDSFEKENYEDTIDWYLSNCKVDVQNNIIDIESNAQQFTITRKQLKTAMEKLVKGNQDIIQYQDELNKKEKELTDAKLEISRKTTELDKTEKVERIRLKDAKETLEQGEKEYQESLETLDDVGAQIEWYAFDRSENPGWSSYGDDADRVDRIARIFPVFFLLVASLVCLTTVTRMVEEQRTEIGTCKALGYSGASITVQYLLYTVLASVLGTAVGTVIGDQLFPKVLFRCYQMMYHYPKISCPYHWGYALICLAASLICTGVTAAAVCSSVVQEMPAKLMRPKAPKNGKRVLLEKWRWLWNKFGFHAKVTIRNFFRYRARVLMSVIGICGCTALLLTGFGLYHAIAAIVDLQYQEVLVYDAVGIYDGSTENKEILRDTLEHTDTVAGYQFGAVRSCTVRTGRRSYEVTVTVPEDAEALSDYIVLRDRKTHEPYQLQDSGIILNEKLASLLNIRTGDNVTLEDADHPAAVTAIAENYALNRVWMTKACYESLFGSMESNCVFINEQPDTDEDALAEHLLRSEALLRLDFTSDSGENFRKLVKALGYVVAVVIVFAGLLALAVLYNLAYINILERQRELATVKVLGFYDKEVYAYVLRENILSSVLGIAAGLFAGIFLCRYVVKTAEVDVVMFAPDIPWYCFVLAACVTLVFTLIVNLLLRRKLRAIDMAGSIKAVE